MVRPPLLRGVRQSPYWSHNVTHFVTLRALAALSWMQWTSEQLPKVCSPNIASVGLGCWPGAPSGVAGGGLRADAAGQAFEGLKPDCGKNPEQVQGPVGKRLV